MGTKLASNDRPDTNRLVWVLNVMTPEDGFSDEDYTFEEEYKNKKYRIPPREKKAVLMKFIKAQHFLGQATGMDSPLPYGGYVRLRGTEDAYVDKSLFGKPLKVVELSKEEKKLFEGLSEKEAMEVWATKDEKKGKGKPQARRTKSVDLSDIPR